jgi:hypothetical protein
MEKNRINVFAQHHFGLSVIEWISAIQSRFDGSTTTLCTLPFIEVSCFDRSTRGLLLVSRRRNRRVDLSDISPGELHHSRRAPLEGDGLN